MNPRDLDLYDKIPGVQSYRDAFASKVIDVASRLRMDPNNLMRVMYFESKLKPNAKNPYSSASGLIQFIESTAYSLGTTTAALRAMSGVDQLDYVERYLKPYKGQLVDLLETYLAVFSPSALGRSDTYAFNLSPYWVNANKIFDLNKDQKIIKGEIRFYLNKYFDHLKKKSLTGIVPALLVIGGLYLMFK